MFDLSFIELIFIAVVALLVIGPKDLPKVAASLFRAFKQMQEVVSDMRGQVEELAKESGVEDAKQEVKTIIDQHGQVQEVYDISEFLQTDGSVDLNSDDEKTTSQSGEDKHV